MSNGESGKGFLGNLFNKVKSTIESATGPAAPAPAPRPQGQTGNLQRPQANASATFTRTTAQLSTPQTAPLTTPVIELTPEEKAEESQRRLAFIMAYLRDPRSVPQFSDPQYVYKVVSDERTYQSELCAGLDEQLKLLLAHANPAHMVEEDEEIPPHEPGTDGEVPPEVQEVLDRQEAKRRFQAERQAIEDEIQKSRDIQTKLFLILKSVTGIKKKTGGTGFLTPPPGI